MFDRPCHHDLPRVPAADVSVDAPFVVTVGLDAALQERLERDRRQYFPAHRNIVPAHISLFHHLPGSAGQNVVATLGSVCSTTAPFDVVVSGVMGLGRGTAYRITADSALHARLASAWRPMLTRQDSQPWHPHVTLQNKVEPGEARALQMQLLAGFTPFGGQANAVRLWRYLGGPWEPAGVFPLTG